MGLGGTRGSGDHPPAWIPLCWEGAECTQQLLSSLEKSIRKQILCFCCPENSQIKSLELPTHILTAKISHKLRVSFSFDKVFFSDIFN